MNKVVVIGAGGAGKSTFAKRLAGRLAIEVIHLDQCYWQPGWVQPAEEEWRRTLEQLLVRESWVMDGNYSGTLARRLEVCDTVIFLDLPTSVCLWRAFKRAMAHFNRTRPDMAPGCPERIDPSFLLWIWNYRRCSRPKVLRLLREYEKRGQVVTLRSGVEIEQFLSTVGLHKEAVPPAK